MRPKDRETCGISGWEPCFLNSRLVPSALFFAAFSVKLPPGRMAVGRVILQMAEWQL